MAKKSEKKAAAPKVEATAVPQKSSTTSATPAGGPRNNGKPKGWL